MNHFRRLNAIAAKLPWTARLDPESREMIEATALRYDLDVDELAEGVQQTIIELAGAGATTTEERVRFICRRDGIDEAEVWAELRENGAH